MRASHSSRCLALSLVLLWGCGGTAPTRVEPTTDQVAQSSRGMVVAAQPLATAAGVEMLERGGNAADAAVAAAFAISVVEPSMNSIGGRTQILVRAADGSFHGIDATTQAPDTYDPDTAPQAGYGYPTVGLPGAVAGLTRLVDEHGTLPLATVMEPAIRYASEGFALLPGEAARQASTAEQLRESEGATLYYLEPDGSPYDAGDHFVQSDLAMVLRRIASGGADAFYRGEIANAMADDIVGAGGHVTAAALAGYRAEDARVVRGSYRGHELVGTFTPAAGAMTIGILQIIENFDMAGADEATWASVVGQALALVRREVASAPQHVQVELVGVHPVRAVEALPAHDVGGDERVDLRHVRQVHCFELEQVGERRGQGDLLGQRVAFADAAGDGQVEIARARRDGALVMQPSGSLDRAAAVGIECGDIMPCTELLESLHSVGHDATVAKPDESLQTSIANGCERVTR